MKVSKLLSRIVIVVLSLCMAFGMMSLVACGTSGDDGVITLSDTSIEVQVGKTKRLTGTITVDGAKLTWSSADESIATVSEAGLVKGIKTGKTTVTAKYENYSATCEVNVIDVVTVELNKTTLALNVGEDETLTATASNGGTITWSSSDASVAKVENGKVTGLKDGTASIYAECVGTRAECEVTVTDTTRKKITKSEEKDITAPDTMFYFNVDNAEVPDESELYYSIADQTYHATFTNSAWAWCGFQLFYKKSGIEGADNNVSFKLNINKGGHITVCGTTIELTEGDNLISLDNFTGTLAIQFGENNGAQSNDITGEVVVTISELTFTHYTPEALVAPTGFTVTGKNIAITDDVNGDKAKAYKVVFYDENDVKVNETTVEKNGEIDDGAIPAGTYTLAVYAYSTGRYTSSDEYKPETPVTYTVEGDVQYDVTFAGEDAITEGKWYYWKEAGTVNAKVLGNKLTVGFEGNSGNWYNVQLFYADPLVDKTKDNKITFTLKSNKAGNIQINGNAISIAEADIDKEVEYTVYNIGSGKATVSIQMGTNAGINITDATMEFTFASPVAVPYDKVKLATPTVSFGENYAYTITDNTNAAASVDNYNLVFYADEKAVTTLKVTEKTGTLDISSVVTGEYTVKVVAAGSGLYSSSDESDGVALNVVNAAGVKYEIGNHGEADACATDNAGKWWYWNDQNWCGSTVTIVGTPSYDNGTITIGYTATGTCDFGLQLFYKDTAFATGTSHKLTIKVTAEKDTTIKVNGKIVELKADEETTIEVTTAEPGAAGASISIQFDISPEHNANTFTLSGITLKEATAEETPAE